LSKRGGEFATSGDHSRTLKERMVGQGKRGENYGKLRESNISLKKKTRIRKRGGGDGEGSMDKVLKKEVQGITTLRKRSRDDLKKV